MAETTKAALIEGAFRRVNFERLAENLAVAVAVSLPWSTSATGILITLWLLALLPTLDFAEIRRGMTVPASALPVAFCALGVLGMAWADVSFAERLFSVKVFLRFLAIPLLLIQFRRSDRGMWVVGGFLASCMALLAASWTLAFWPSLAWRNISLGVPVKDYVIQSSEFSICAFGLAHFAICCWRERRYGMTLALGVIALLLLANIFFVATGRSSLLVMAVLFVVLGLQRFSWQGALGIIVAGTIAASLAWFSSPYLRGRVLAVFQEVYSYQTDNAETSSGFRLEFWRKSIQFVAAAPVIGHGTGSVRELFREAATGNNVASAAVTDNPHNQTLVVALQLGLLGVGVLYAMWIAHLLLFRGNGLAAWLGLGVVLQSMVSCLFNSYLFETTLGWFYVFGVGVLGGMALQGGRPPEARAPS